MGLELKVIVPKGVLLDTRPETVILPGTEGDLQILPDHLPVFTPLRMGPLLLDAAGEHQVAIFGGIAEVQANRITVLAQNAELAKKIDIERALAARERAVKRLERAHTDQNIDILRAQAALNRALLRLSVSGHRESN